MEENNLLLEKLLDKALSIVEKDKSIKKERENRGDLFNIFSVLSLETAEVYHSKMIACLLDPKGLHGCGDLFFKASPFAKLIKGTINSITVETEKNSGPIDVKYENGGRMDVFIEVNSNEGKTAICIENKVYAADQRNQLSRYQNYLKRYYPEHWYLFYLTPDGREYSDKSKVEYNPISYRTEISDWIKRCIEIAVDKPLIRETLFQYLSTINLITNNEMEGEMEKELINMIIKDNKGYIEAFGQLDSVKWQLKKQIYMNFIAKLNENPRYKYQYNDGSIWFEKENWKKNNLCICFEFGNSEFMNLYYGIALTDVNSAIKLPEDLKECCQNLGFKSNTIWAGWKYMEAPYRNWSFNTLQTINDTPEVLAGIIVDITEKLEKVIDDCIK